MDKKQLGPSITLSATTTSARAVEIAWINAVGSRSIGSLYVFSCFIDKVLEVP